MEKAAGLDGEEGEWEEGHLGRALNREVDGGRLRACGEEVSGGHGGWEIAVGAWERGALGARTRRKFGKGARSNLRVDGGMAERRVGSGVWEMVGVLAADGVPWGRGTPGLVVDRHRDGMGTPCVVSSTGLSSRPHSRDVGVLP